MLPSCIVIGCINSQYNSTIKYYRMPTHNTTICKQWYINTLREDLQPSIEHYVCVEHFDEESFIQNYNGHINDNLILKEDAVPSLFEIEVFQKMIAHQERITVIPQTQQQTSNSLLSINNQQNTSLLSNLITSMPTTLNKCSLKTCINSYIDKTPPVDVYQLPKNADIAKKWMYSCGIYENTLKLCREHFIASDFNEYGFLKPDAIPTQFHNTLLTRNDTNLKRTNQNLNINQRMPKAFKRTGPQIQQKKEQKAVKHTNSIFRLNQPQQQQQQQLQLQQPQVLSNQTSASQFLSAALNNTQVTNANTSTFNTQKVQKAVKHTSASNLLKDILPPPIMQSTKRAPKAVKHTGGGNFNFYNQNLSTSTSNNLSNIQISKSQFDQIADYQRLNETNNIINGINLNESRTQTTIQSTSIIQQIQRPTTYVYKRVNQQPEMELYLECEDDDVNDTLNVIKIEQTTQTQQQLINKPIEDEKENKNEIKLNENEKKFKLSQIKKRKTIYRPIASIQTSLLKQAIEAEMLNNYNKKKQQITQKSNIKTNALKQNENKMQTQRLTSTQTSTLKHQKIIEKQKSPPPPQPQPSPSPSPTPTQQQQSKSQLSQKIPPPSPTQPKSQIKQQTLPQQPHMQILMRYYSRKDGMNSSIKSNKQQKYRAKCNICELILDNNIELTSHICSHLEGSSYISPFDAVTTVCCVCDRKFNQPFELIKHLDSEHMKKLCEYKCRICERQNENINELYKHLNETHKHHDMPYNCEVCSFRTSFYADAIYHIKKEHVNTLYCFCPYCLKSIQLAFNDKLQHAIVANFYAHLITHFTKTENNELVESKCKHCPKCILHVRYLKEHLANDHKLKQKQNDGQSVVKATN